MFFLSHLIVIIAIDWEIDILSVMIRVYTGLDKSDFCLLVWYSASATKGCDISGFPIYLIHFFWAGKKIFYLPSRNFHLSGAAGQWICQTLSTLLAIPPSVRAPDNFFQQGVADSSLCGKGVFLQHLVVL